MLKRLAIFGLVAWFIGGAWPQIPREGNHQDQKSQGSNSKAEPAPPILQASQSQQSSTAQKQNSNAKPSEYQWHELLAPANMPSWCLVLVGIWAGGMAYWTLRKIETQTEQLKGQAILMREQMDMMVHKDRARLNIYAQPIQIVNLEGGFYHLSTCIELTNSGQSKAYITFSAGRFVVVPSSQGVLSQPDPDDLSPASNVVEASDEPVYVPFYFEDALLGFQEFTGKIANGDLTAYLYGFVEYETLGKKRHSDFGYAWIINESMRNSSFHSSEELIDGGSWEICLNLKNGESEIKPN